MLRPLLALVPTVLACSGAPPRPGTGDPSALVACWRDAIGGSRLAEIRSIEREARTEADGLTGTLHTWLRLDGASRDEETLGPSSEITVYADGRAWFRPALGPALEMTHRDLARVK